MREFHHARKRRLPTVGLVLGAAVLLSAAARASYAVEIFDDFSDNNDTANPTWTHLDGAVGSTGQTWDASTGAYRMTAPSSGEIPELFGYGFVGSYAGPQYTDVRVMADIVDHPTTAIGGFFGVAARLNGDNSAPVFGEGIKLHGYSYQYEAHARGGLGEMVLNILYGDGFIDIGSDPVSLDVTKDYRFVLEVVGNVLHGQTYELDANGQVVGLISEKTRDLDAEPVGDVNHDADPTTPEQPFVPYASGYSGVYAVGHLFYTDADVTIDNFRTESLVLAGDFNKDGVVDSSDLAQWQADYGTNAGSDADGDGDTDGNDFLLWQQNVGATSAGGAAAVPEPAAAGLGLVAFGCFWSASRQRSLARR